MSAKEDKGDDVLAIHFVVYMRCFIANKMKCFGL